jgi:ketosteroid isomerase-like protein
MSDESDIQRTINTYSQVASLVQVDKVLELYQPDGVWAVPSQGMRCEGHAEIAAQMKLYASAMEFVLQGNSPSVIDIDGDTATARTSIRETGKVAGQDMGFEYIGIYVDKLVRTPGGWKFAERVCEVIGGMTYPINKLSV